MKHVQNEILYFFNVHIGRTFLPNRHLTRSRYKNSKKTSVNYPARNDRHEDPLLSSYFRVEKNIEQFLFSKLTPWHHEHGTGPGTHLKRHTVGGQTTRTKRNVTLYLLPTTRLQRPMVSKRYSPYAATTRRHNTHREVIRDDHVLYTPYAKSYTHAYNKLKVD